MVGRAGSRRQEGQEAVQVQEVVLCWNSCLYHLKFLKTSLEVGAFSRGSREQLDILSNDISHQNSVNGRLDGRSWNGAKSEVIITSSRPGRNPSRK